MNPLIWITGIMTVGSMLLVYGVVRSLGGAVQTLKREENRDRLESEVAEAFLLARTEIEECLRTITGPHPEGFSEKNRISEAVNKLSIDVREIMELPKNTFGSVRTDEQETRRRIYTEFLAVAKSQVPSAGLGAILIFASTLWWLAIS